MSATQPSHRQQGTSRSSPQPVRQGSGRAVGAPALRLEVWGATDRGRERQGNEDYVYPDSGADTFAWQPSAEQVAQNGRLLLVADGVGGAQGGREASSSAAKIVAERYYELTSPDPGENLRVAIEEANSSLCQQIAARRSLQDAGTTITAAVVKDSVLHVANVGDSRTYLIRNGQITPLTHDHTLTQQKLNHGLIRPDQVEMDSDRNVLTRSLGAGSTVQVDVFPQLQLTPGDVILLCSDGLTDMLGDQEIARIVERSSPRRAANELIQKANRRGGFDNISVVIAKVGGRREVAVGAIPSGIRGMTGQQKAMLSIGAVLVAIASCALAYLGWTMYGRSGNEPTATPTATATAGIVPGATAAMVTHSPQPQPTSTAPPPTDTVRPMQPTSTPAPTFTPTNTPLPDRDVDGVPDSLDDCPDQSGSRALRGCPDSDRDGIIDMDDDCPNAPGLPQFNGCPDSDEAGSPDDQGGDADDGGGG